MSVKQALWPLCIILAVSVLVGCARSNNYQDLSLQKETEIASVATKPHSLAIAFGGGGLRGYMHLGVIKALTEQGIKADLVTGSSAGSIAATLYASGQSYEALEKIIDDFNELKVTDFVVSKRGLVNGQDLADWINQSVPQTLLSDMSIPVGITATDMTSFDAVLIQDGNPGRAVQTSSTIPGAFVPVEHQQHLLVDGGVLHVVPVDYAKAMGADIVIGVDIYCGNQTAAEISALKMQLATFRLLACRLSENEINRADIIVRPQYEPEQGLGGQSKQAAIEAGYQAMLEQMPALLKRLNTPSTSVKASSKGSSL